MPDLIGEFVSFFDQISIALQPTLLLASFAGALLGIVWGSLPGLSTTMAMALLIGFSTIMNLETAIMFLLAVYMGSTLGWVYLGDLRQYPRHARCRLHRHRRLSPRPEGPGRSRARHRAHRVFHRQPHWADVPSLPLPPHPRPGTGDRRMGDVPPVRDRDPARRKSHRQRAPRKGLDLRMAGHPDRHDRPRSGQCLPAVHVRHERILWWARIRADHDRPVRPGRGAAGATVPHAL